MAAVAYADYIVVSISLGYLYVLPLGISAIFLRKEICYFLTVVCVLLHDLFGPPYPSLGARIGHNLTALVGFVFVVAVIQRYAAQRNALAREVRNQRDDLLHDVELAAQVQRMFLSGSQPSIPCSLRISPRILVPGISSSTHRMRCCEVAQANHGQALAQS
jgi:hypothetical protein